MSQKNKKKLHPQELERRRAKKQLLNAYNAGMRASYAGETILANPYFEDHGDESHQRWQYWRGGWKDAEWNQCKQPTLQ
jgi:hypothetical protein